VSQAELIAEAHLGAVTVERTQGLGHHRILNDPDVIETIRSFIDLAIGEHNQAYRTEHVEG
jgi:hypothetical protein